MSASTSEPLPRYGSIERATDYFGIGRTTLYQLIGEGKLIARKLGRKTLLDFHHAEAFLSALPAADIRPSFRR